METKANYALIGFFTLAVGIRVNPECRLRILHLIGMDRRPLPDGIPFDAHLAGGLSNRQCLELAP